MCENLDTACTLTFSFDKNLKHKPTGDEMENWLQNESGLFANYFEKIKLVKYDEDAGLEITFDEKVNCFIAMKQIVNRVLYGRNGKYEISIKCPRGVFKMVYLMPRTVELLSTNYVIGALKEFGEIIDIQDVKWRDMTSKHGNYIPTGNVSVRMVIKKPLPEILDIGGITTDVEERFYQMQHNNEILQKLWNNCKTEKRTCCRIIIKHNTDAKYVPTQGDVYEWLVSYSGLSEGYLRRIAAFKSVTPGQYEIVFQNGVNCLIAMQQIKYRSIYHSNGIGETMVDISCPKGRFISVTVQSDPDKSPCMNQIDEASQPVMKRSRLDLDQSDSNACSVMEIVSALMVYGNIVNRTGLNTLLKPDFDGTTQCKMFVSSKLPKSLQVNGKEVCVEYAEARPEDYDEELLNKIWQRIAI